MSLEQRQQGRVLVFVVAYDAKKHIRAVFDRVPPELFEDPRVHFLCIDDASDDDGPEVLARWVRDRGAGNVTVLRNPVNQGYGGNQKLGYRAALDSGFDFVILLHGDGQYAPELLPRFIETWRNTGADVVLGSRMRDAGTARAGGMPLYKLVGNRVLTWFQNGLTGLGLSEYHTGYRGYSARFLDDVPFETNTNDFHFDTQILLQAGHVGAKIVEFAIPTHYGDEVCHVPGLRYAANVAGATLQYKLHQLGMLCSLKYRRARPWPVDGAARRPYAAHAMALRVVERHRPRRLLDIGCGPGFVARGCEHLETEVTGIDAWEPLDGMMSHFWQVDVQREPLPVDAFAYDTVLLLDVIDHLEDPERFLLELRNQSRALRSDRQGPLVLVSTPNVAFIVMRLNLLLGRFTYSQRGILDIARKRLFTRTTLHHMLRDCGYAIESIRPVGVPFHAVVGGRLGALLESVSQALARLWPTMFAFQFLVQCRPLPSVKQILHQSEPHHLAAAAA